MLILIFLLSLDVSGFWSHFCGFFFFSCNTLLNKLQSLSISSFKHTKLLHYYYVRSASLLLSVLVLILASGGWNNFPYRFTRLLHVFFFTPSHHIPPDSWIFKCLIPLSFICFLYHKVFSSWPVSIFVYLPCHFSAASPGTVVSLSYK